jgi:cysteine desulfurase/selenocysteine lyase
MHHIQQGDEILITQLEHHANILPWQRLAARTGARLVWVPVLSNGMLDMDQFHLLINRRTKLVAVTALSNALGTLVDVQACSAAARAVGARVLVDAAQYVAHRPIAVTTLGADFLVFSGHKMFGPTGIGVLYITKQLHDDIPPYQVGGGMVFEVLQDHAVWLKSPHKFEAGTPAIAGAIGLAAAITFITEYIPWPALEKHESSLCAHLIKGLQAMPHVHIIGPIEQLKESGHLVSFIVDTIHAHDVAAYLDSKGIAVRAGNHCAQPLARALGYTASVRASFAAYSTLDEVQALVQALDQIRGG